MQKIKVRSHKRNGSVVSEHNRKLSARQLQQSKASDMLKSLLLPSNSKKDVKTEVAKKIALTQFEKRKTIDPKYYGYNSEHPGAQYCGDEDEWNSLKRLQKGIETESGKKRLSSFAKKTVCDREDEKQLPHPKDRYLARQIKHRDSEIDWVHVGKEILEKVGVKKGIDYEASGGKFQSIPFEESPCYKTQRENSRSYYLEKFKQAKNLGVSKVDDFLKNKITSAPTENVKRTIKRDFTLDELREYGIELD